MNERPNWTPLRDALRLCRAENALPQFWWRDDDAIEPTAALDRLTALADRLGVPVHLAVIPAPARTTLVAHCADAPLIPVVHGWAHADRSAPEDKKNEFLTPRPGAIQDAAQGLAQLQTLFGPQLRAMFVPPWNRINETVTAALPDMGYTVLSTYGPRARDSAGILRVNTHVDPIDWKGTRGLVDPQTLIDGAAAQLIARSRGEADQTEPFGLLTHHLVHTPDIWQFTEAFLAELLDAGAPLWTMET